MTPAYAAYILARYLCGRYVRQGATIEELAAETGLSYRRIRETLLAFRVTLRPPRIPLPPTPPGLVAAYQDGRSIRQLATRYRMSYNQTRNVLLGEGVELRARGTPSMDPTTAPRYPVTPRASEDGKKRR